MIACEPCLSFLHHQFSSRPLFRSVGWIGNTDTSSTATHCTQTETEVPKNAAMWYGSYGECGWVCFRAHFPFARSSVRR